MTRLTFVCFALAAVSSCGPSPQGPNESDAAEAAIQVATRSWISAYEQGDADALANLFEEDAMYAANTGEVLHGRDGIRDGVRAWLASRPADVELDLEVQAVRFVFTGNSAHTVSLFVLRAMPTGCSIDAGHGLAVWRPQSDGSWLITTQLVNRDPEPPADACPRAAAILPDEASLSTLRRHPGYSTRPVVFLNLLDFGSIEAQARYMDEYAVPALKLIADRGGSLVWAGSVDQQLVGDAGNEWDYAAFVRWPSRGAFVSMIESDEYRRLHRVRQETLQATSIMVASEAAPPEE